MVPLTSTVRTSAAEVVIEPDEANHLRRPSSAECQHVRSVATTRIQQQRGSVGAIVLTEIRETLALLLDLETRP